MLLMRSVAYAATQNFEAAIDDLSDCLQADTASALAYWQRAVCQSKVNEFNASLGTDMAMKYANVLADLEKAIALDANSPYLYYNRANVYAARKDYARAIDDYTRAIAIDGNLAEAYYNRGLARIFSQKTAEGVADLSKAGELGLYNAYSIIKRYQAEKKR